jgi:hypothetical protein
LFFFVVAPYSAPSSFLSPLSFYTNANNTNFHTTAYSNNNNNNNNNHRGRQGRKIELRDNLRHSSRVKGAKISRQGF